MKEMTPTEIALLSLKKIVALEERQDKQGKLIIDISTKTTKLSEELEGKANYNVGAACPKGYVPISSMQAKAFPELSVCMYKIIAVDYKTPTKIWEVLTPSGIANPVTVYNVKRMIKDTNDYLNNSIQITAKSCKHNAGKTFRFVL